MVDNSVSFEKSIGIWCCIFRPIPRTATLCFFCSDKVSKPVNQLFLAVTAAEMFQKYLTNLLKFRSSSDQFLKILKKFLKICTTSC